MSTLSLSPETDRPRLNLIVIASFRPLSLSLSIESDRRKLDRPPLLLPISPSVKPKSPKSEELFQISQILEGMISAGSRSMLTTTPPYKINNRYHVRNAVPFNDLRTTVDGSNSIRRCECLNLYKQLVPYKQAWEWQRSLVQRRHSLIRKEADNSDTVVVLQHPSVYTLGTGSSEEYMNFDMSNAPFEVYRTERGGEVTYHGPGQIVIYPILNLRHYQMDLHWYLRCLEEVIIRALSSSFSINATRHKGLTGVWVGDEKIAAIGIRASKWVTYHGLAVNVTADLTPFQHIVPCGIKDKKVTGLKQLLFGTETDTSEVIDSRLIDMVHESLIREFSEVFQVSFDFKSIADFNL